MACIFALGGKKGSVDARHNPIGLEKFEGFFKGPAWFILWAVAFQFLWLAYLPSLAGPFHYDDFEAIVTNEDLRHPLEPWRLFRDHHISLEFDRRPVTGLMTLVDFQIHGLNSFGYRLSNLLLHFCVAVVGAATISAIALRFRCLAPRAFGTVVSLIWMFHPLATSTVSFIFQRSEMLMAFFYLLALLALIRARNSKRERGWLWACGVFAVLSALSKEPGLTLIVALPLVERICCFESFGAQLRSRWPLYSGLLASVSVIVIWIFGGTRMGELNQPTELAHPVGYFKAQCTTLAHYIRLVFWPEPLVFFSYPRDLTSPSKWIPSLVFLSATGIALFVAGFKRRWIWVGLACFLSVLAPTTSFFPLPTEPVAEFRMYMPLLVALAVVLAGLLLWLQGAFPRGQLSYGAFLLFGLSAFSLLGILGTASHARNRIYATPTGPWLDVVKNEPLNPKGWANLGQAHLNLREWEMARQCGRQLLLVAAKIRSPEAAMAGERIIACVDLNQGKADAALGVLKRLSQQMPKMPGIHRDLALAYARSGLPEEALTLAAGRPELADGTQDGDLVRIEAYLHGGDPNRAFELLKVAQKKFPGWVEVQRLEATLSSYNSAQLLPDGTDLDKSHHK